MKHPLKEQRNRHRDRRKNRRLQLVGASVTRPHERTSKECQGVDGRFPSGNAPVRYWIFGPPKVDHRSTAAKVLLMGNAAVALAVRDKWIGWSRQERLAHLPWVINNQRLLLFPWVRVPHLVSHVLAGLS